MDVAILPSLVVGRVKPHVYAFSTHTVPDYLKVGDTYRPVETRLDEWREHFPELVPEFEDTALVSDDRFFRDHAVHDFLENTRHFPRLSPSDLPSGVYYSREFFRGAAAPDVADAISDIRADFSSGAGRYRFYDAATALPARVRHASEGWWEPRPNQREAVERFLAAVSKGRRNLLMYAVMRFGKSFTALCCARAMRGGAWLSRDPLPAGTGASLVVIVSAKADVMPEWRRTVEAPENFRSDYGFYDAGDFRRNPAVVDEALAAGRRAVVFLTLQDLQGAAVKTRYARLLRRKVDLLVVDETHFGARAESYGAILRATRDTASRAERAEATDPDAVPAAIKRFRATVTLHLSGTPYRILMGGEFSRADIVSFCQFSDIVRAKEEWDRENVLKDDVDEWDNPYWGFPQMIRFAFNPSEAAFKRLRSLRDSGQTCAFSALFEPVSVRPDPAGGAHRRFKYESEVLDLFAVMDGSRTDDALFSFLDYDGLKRGMMCRHMVCVLPFCASCDALAALLAAHAAEFKNLGSYEILNISGHDCPKALSDPDGVRAAVSAAEAAGRKTLVLTVSRMLTGSTVPVWDTMLYFKDTSSPQEYDQAVFRLQNQFIEERRSPDGDVIRYDKKPQTLLVDFDPARLFRMQEEKAKIYNAAEDKSGNARLARRLAEELRISPVVRLSAGRLVRVEPADVMAAVADYSRSRGVSDEARAVAVDLAALDADADLKAAIERENPIDSRDGFTIRPHQGPERDPDLPGFEDPENPSATATGSGGSSGDADGADESAAAERRDLEKRLRAYYARILFFAFLTKDRVSSVEEIVAVMERGAENKRIARNVGISKSILKSILKRFDPFVLSGLDYKIDNLSRLSADTSEAPLERARTMLRHFDRFGAAEIVTPAPVAERMVALLPDDEFAAILDGGGRFLDIASKSGEFAVALYARAKALRPALDLSRRICSVPSSPHAYEFTRKTYEALGLDLACVATFTAYDLLDALGDSPGPADYRRVSAILSQKKPFCKIAMTDASSTRRNHKSSFALVIGNPPYQEDVKNEGDRPNPIYNRFMDLVYSTSDKAILITPGRFLFNAGQTPKEWNEKMLDDKHLRVAFYEQKSDRVFPNVVDIKGGIVITHRDTSQDFGKIGLFTTFQELNSILKAVLTKENEKAPMFDSIISQRGQYRFSDRVYSEHPEAKDCVGDGTGNMIASNAFINLPTVFFENEPEEGRFVKLLGRINGRRVYRYINEDYLTPNDYLGKWNVLVPESNGTGTLGEELTNPTIVGPMVGATDTFISIGCFGTESEAKACLKYVKTKFLRTMLGILKATHHNKRETWRYVPLQDFTSASDIDWTLPVPDIDKQLYDKYGLSDSERAFIESMIKPME